MSEPQPTPAEPASPPAQTRLESLIAWAKAHFLGLPTLPPGETADDDALPADHFVPLARAADWKGLKKKDAEHILHWRPEPFYDLLPWIDYLPHDGTFLLEDGRSRGIFFELEPLSAEAKSDDWFRDTHRRLEAALCTAVTESEPPWLLQFYLQDDPHAPRRLPAQLREYAATMNPDGAVNPVTEPLCAALERHTAMLCRPQGLFFDEQVTGMAWRGKTRVLRAVLYRRTPDVRGSVEINEVGARFAAALEALGIRTRRGTGDDFYDWMLPWLSPNPIGDDPYRLLTEGTRPTFGPTPDGRPRRPFALPWGWDLSQWLVRNYPYSEFASRTWWFDCRPHAVISIDRLDREPEPGLLSAERRQGRHRYAVFDRLPEGTVLSLTIEIRPQDLVKQHLQRLINGSRAGSAEAEQTHAHAQAALHLLGRGHALFPTAIACYVRGNNPSQLAERRLRAEAMLSAHGLAPIRLDADLMGLDSYIRCLPMNFSPTHDRRARRARLQFSYDLAGLVPLYGRARGSGHGVPFWNRGGEPLQFDPLNPADRTKNAHLVLLGPPGAGKSAQLVYLMLAMLAIHRPRVFLIEAGNSFGLLVQWLARAGLKTHSVRIQPSSPVSLCPFTHAQLLLAQPARLSEDLPDDVPEAPEERAEDGNRDLLGEMELAARIMITGGEEKEDAKLTRADRFRLRAAIVAAAERSRDDGRDQTLTRDVVAALREIAAHDDSLTARQRERTGEMADALALFTQGTEGAFFDREGEPWPEADVTHIDLAMYARDGNSDKLVVTMVGLFNRINDLAERYQHSARQNIVMIDEAHVLTTNAMLAPYLTKIVKMWRKLGCWLWLATQNLQDFPDTAKKLLNIVEWWLLLVMPKEEVGELARFRNLSDEQRELLLSATKDPGQYIEGVILSDRVQALFRSVLPALVLALSQTEKHEKAERARLMREHGVDELGAAELVAAAIEASREAA